MLVGAFQYRNIEAFHKHLDTCKRCRDRPFDLCPEGGSLLVSCVSGTSGTLTPRRTDDGGGVGGARR